MSKRRERTFEDEVVAHLTAHGWLEGQSAGYDRELALYPEDVLGWLEATQPNELAKLGRLHNGDAIAQYRQDRPPRDPATNRDEPLLQLKRRALIHFAASTLGAAPAAYEALTHALTTAAPCGQIAVFHQGPWLTRLLRDAWQQGMASAYLTHVLTALALLPDAEPLPPGATALPGADRQAEAEAPLSTPRRSAAATQEAGPAELAEPLSEREHAALVIACCQV